MIRITAVIIAMSFMLLGISTSANAQGQGQGMPPNMQQEMPDIEVSDDEMRNFVEVTMDAQEVQNEAQGEMIELVEESGMSVDRFNEILSGMQEGNSQEDMDVDDEEMENFDSVIEELEVIQQGVEEKITTKIEENDMEVERFQEINMALQMSPELQEKYQSIAEEMMGSQQGMMQGNPDM
ncbi:MAG: DUF4168 domain-containing protein [Cyclonatronaceae bacterium]